MSLNPLQLSLVVALCLASGEVFAAGAQNGTSAAGTATAITLAQADQIISKNGFTPIGQPTQQGNVIGSLALVGKNTFIVTVDATTGQFLDAKPASVALPSGFTGSAQVTPGTGATPPAAQAIPATAPVVAAPVITAPAPAANTPAAAAANNKAVSPVLRATNLVRSKGFRVISFKHVNDDTFIVARRGDDLFQLKVDDDGRLLATTRIRREDDD